MKKLALLIIVVFLFSCEKKEDTSDTGVTPDIPTATVATDITNSSFYANWTNSSNATSYEIDVATDSYFNMIVKTVKGANGPTAITNLTANTRYHYRVRAVNESGVSGNSNVVSAFILPDAPVALDATLITSNSFTVNWLWSGSITSYLLYVSTEDFNATPHTNLPNYDGITVVSNTHKVTGLTPGTKYYYALKAANGSNISFLSNVVNCTTLN